MAGARQEEVEVVAGSYQLPRSAINLAAALRVSILMPNGFTDRGHTRRLVHTSRRSDLLNVFPTSHTLDQ